MRVAHVTPVYPPYHGGIGAVAAEYARGLRARGVDVTVFTPEYASRRAPRVESRQVDGVMRLRPWYAWGLAAFVPQLLWRLRGFDVIHVHHACYGGEEAAALASLVWRIPLVVTYHMQPKASGWVGAIMRLHRRVVEPCVLRRAKKILVSSREYANENTFSIENVFSELPFGVDTRRFSPGRDDAFRARYGIPVDAKLVVFVGGLDDAHYFKGLPVLMTAMQQNAAYLFVVGDGNRRRDYETEAQRLGIAARTHFAGALPHDDLPRAYRASDVHVLPSIDRSEAFGLVTLEAMASGIPSVVSDLPGMRTLVVPGETGFLAPPRDAAALAQRLAELLQQDSCAAAMGARARERAMTHYDAERVLDRLLEIYRTL